MTRQEWSLKAAGIHVLFDAATDSLAKVKSDKLAPFPVLAMKRRNAPLSRPYRIIGRLTWPFGGNGEPQAAHVESGTGQ